jgi:hypothetical protein
MNKLAKHTRVLQIILDQAGASDMRTTDRTSVVREIKPLTCGYLRRRNKSVAPELRSFRRRTPLRPAVADLPPLH